MMSGFCVIVAVVVATDDGAAGCLVVHDVESWFRWRGDCDSQRRRRQFRFRGVVSTSPFVLLLRHIEEMKRRWRREKSDVSLDLRVAALHGANTASVESP